MKAGDKLDINEENILHWYDGPCAFKINTEEGLFFFILHQDIGKNLGYLSKKTTDEDMKKLESNEIDLKTFFGGEGKLVETDGTEIFSVRDATPEEVDVWEVGWNLFP